MVDIQAIVELAATFGAKRADGPAWKGIFIKAAEGSEVHAAGAGEVVQADGADPSSVVHALCCWHASRHHDMQLNPP